MSSTSVSLQIDDWLRGLLFGGLGAFSGFLLGALIAAIMALQASPPVWAASMPYVGSLGGLSFGFVAGAGRDLIF